MEEIAGKAKVIPQVGNEARVDSDGGRAQGLILTGAYFKQVGKEAMAALKAQGEGGTAAVKLDAKHLEELMLKTMAMGQGQEV